jgi:ATP-dependent Clp protease ATP-binding subunit ClpX
MTEQRNAIIRQYQKLFELDGAEINFEPDSLREIAKQAMSRETGVRAIRSLVEEFLRDLLYELPERKDVVRYHVTARAFRGEEPVKCVLKSEKPTKKRDSA